LKDALNTTLVDWNEVKN
jgi:hypothetical protein